MSLSVTSFTSSTVPCLQTTLQLAGSLHFYSTWHASVMQWARPRAPSIMLRRSGTVKEDIGGPPIIGPRVALDASSSMVIS